jgi:anion-transporting  ArsA/GET3 family ATPase
MTKTMDFDVVVFDTAPTGHTLRLLQMPGSITKMIEKFLQLNANMGGMLSQVRWNSCRTGRADPGPQGSCRQWLTRCRFST